MTDSGKLGGPGRRNEGPEFDLVEDIGDAAAFDRALDELLPKGELGPAGRFDIDPDDFEAFNRELDAQMAQARARNARHDTVEDLGIDVVAAPILPVAEPEPAPARVPAPASAPDEPDVAEDVVTLGAAAAATAPPERPAPPAPSPPVAPTPATAAASGSRVGRGAGLAVLLGLAGLAAGGVALWMSVEREAELTRLRADLAARDAVAVVPPAAPAAPGADADRVRELEGRLEEVSRRLAQLAARPVEPPKPPPAARATPPPPPAPEAPVAAPPVVPAVAKSEPKPPEPEAKPPDAPASIPAAAVEAGAAAPAATAAGAASPPASATSPAPEPPAPAPVAPAQALPRPSGTGSWAVVIDSYADESDADKRRAQVERMNLPAEVRWFLVKDEVRYRVIVPGYSTQEAANTAAAELRRRKAGGAWVMRLPKQD